MLLKYEVKLEVFRWSLLDTETERFWFIAEKMKVDVIVCRYFGMQCKAAQITSSI